MPTGHSHRHILEAVISRAQWSCGVTPRSTFQRTKPTFSLLVLQATPQGRTPAPLRQRQAALAPASLAGQVRPWLHGRLPWDDAFCSWVPPCLPANSWLTLGAPMHQEGECTDSSKCLPPSPACSDAAYVGSALAKIYSYEGKTKTLSPGVNTVLSLLSVPASILAKMMRTVHVYSVLEHLLGCSMLPALLLGPGRGS